MGNFSASICKHATIFLIYFLCFDCCTLANVVTEYNNRKCDYVSLLLISFPLFSRLDISHMKMTNRQQSSIACSVFTTAWMCACLRVRAQHTPQVVFKAGKICISFWFDHWRFCRTLHEWRSTLTHMNLISCCVRAQKQVAEINWNTHTHTFAYIAGSKSHAVCRANCFTFFHFLKGKFHFFGCKLAFFMLSLKSNNLEKTTTLAATITAVVTRRRIGWRYAKCRN